MFFNRFLILIALLFTSLTQAEQGPTVSLKELSDSCIQETLSIKDFGDCDNKDRASCACRESTKFLKNACESAIMNSADSCGSKINVNSCVSRAFQINFDSEVKSIKAKVDEFCAEAKPTVATVTPAPVAEASQAKLLDYTAEDRDNSAAGKALKICKSGVKRAQIVKTCESKKFNECVCQNYETEHEQACETAITLQIEACREFRKKDDLMAACLMQHKDILEGQVKKANSRMEKTCNINFSKVSPSID